MGARRLWALVHGLPPDAAVWRETERWSTQDELLATLIERHDSWARAQFGAMRHEKRIRVPDVARIKRPGEDVKRVESDPQRIRAFFQQHIHG